MAIPARLHANMADINQKEKEVFSLYSPAQKK